MGLELSHQFKKCGYIVPDLYASDEISAIEQFAREWIQRVLSLPASASMPIEAYHQWGAHAGVDHNSVFKAANRHCVPPSAIGELIVNDALREVLLSIGIKEYDLWDEGLGWLAFRFIRPGKNDGYPMSCKAWGPAKEVISCWIPVIGHSSKETLLMVPGSHLKEYKRHLPEESKFTKDEYRLAEAIGSDEQVRPTLRHGQAILYHPRLLHSEDVLESDVTRLNLEFRIRPSHWNS